ncbi:ribosome-inactivating family protein [Actinoallomurus sp. CA-150999]|uniref:ribosome-inactivating family protein n=1 Tax=Actinoallomurus sp. CA-150999 TaxID=3239887 RepID=UPI003D89F270
MAATGGCPTARATSTLSGSLTAIGGNIRLSYDSLLNALATLRTTRLPDQNPDVARALLFFIQYVSEAARFRPVAAGMTRLMTDRRNEAPGLPDGLQELENDWSALSRYAYEWRNGNPPPLYVGPAFGRIGSYQQLRQVVMLLLGNLNQVPPPGNLYGEYLTGSGRITRVTPIGKGLPCYRRRNGRRRKASRDTAGRDSRASRWTMLIPDGTGQRAAHRSRGNPSNRQGEQVCR